MAVDVINTVNTFCGYSVDLQWWLSANILHTIQYVA